MNLLYETCAVCDRRFNKIADKNYFELYRDAKIALKHGCRMSSGFVCRKCAQKAATVKCSIFGEVERNFVTTHSDGRDSFAKRRLDQERFFLQNVRNRLVDVGSPAIISEDATFVCDNCIRNALDKAREAAIARVGVSKTTSQSLWFKFGTVQDENCCCRCGQEVQENFASLFKAYADFFMAPFGNMSLDEQSEVWEAARGYLSDPHDVALEDRFREVLCRVVFTGQVDETFFREPESVRLERLRKSYMPFSPFVRARFLCKSCCAYLMSDKARTDLDKERGKEWIGCFETDTPPGCSKRVVFDRISFEADRSDAESQFIKKARHLGANAVVDLKRKATEDLITYVWSGVPVVLVKDNPFAQVVRRIIIDGSNIVFADQSKQIAGLKTCLNAIAASKISSFVFLDANILHKLEESKNGVAQVEMLKDLIAKSNGTIAIVPAGARADDFILKKADTENCHILSNDRYLPYVERYPWIEQGRVHRFAFVDGRLMIPDLDIDVENN